MGAVQEVIVDSVLCRGSAKLLCNSVAWGGAGKKAAQLKPTLPAAKVKSRSLVSGGR